jgi:hypothetical protein
VRDSLVRGEGQRGRMSRAARYGGRTAFASFHACRFVRSWSCTGRTGNVCMHACSAPSCGTSCDKAEGLFFFAYVSFGYSYKAI